jgi:hypothetical protein
MITLLSTLTLATSLLNAGSSLDALNGAQLDKGLESSRLLSAGAHLDRNLESGLSGAPTRLLKPGNLLERYPTLTLCG